MNDEWVKEWTTGPLELDDEALEWLRTRPDEIKDLMRKFPPSCLVKAKGDMQLYAPAPDVIGVVRSYLETEEEAEISVSNHPDSDFRAFCKPEWLEVVGYYKGLTPEVLDGLLRSEK